MARHAINPPGLPVPPTFSRAVSVSGAGRTIYVAGIGPLDDHGSVVGVGDMEAQAEVCFSKLARILAADGASVDDLVQLTLYVTDMGKMRDVQVVRSRYLTGSVLPAISGMGVSALASPEWLIEIDGIAFVDG